MPLMTLVLFASVFPLYFPFQYLSTRDRHYFRGKVFETLERRFTFGRFRRFHKASYRTLALIQSLQLPSQCYPYKRQDNNDLDNDFFGIGIVPNQAPNP
jgi:hypothetical protein